MKVINFHFINACNFTCKYCYNSKEKHTINFDNLCKVIDNISSYTKENIRINLVGGEIFLCNKLQDLIDYIISKGLEVSIVTNGYLLTEEFIEYNKDKIKTIGISIDSLNSTSNKQLGRCFKGSVIPKERLLALCSAIKRNNVKLKINICVTNININDNFSESLELIKPDRLKIFQVNIKKHMNQSLRELEISDIDFFKYCLHYYKFKPICEFSEEMDNSYIIIDYKYNIYTNTDFLPIGNVLEEEFETLIDKVNKNIDLDSYNKRYN